MLDFFQDLKTEYNQKIRIFRSNIDSAFVSENSNVAQEQDRQKVSPVGENDLITGEQVKMQLYGNFIQYHIENVKRQGKDFADFLRNTFDNYFFMVIKTNSVFQNPMNEEMFNLSSNDLNALKNSIHPSMISALSYKGQALTLYYAMQKAIGRFASGEAIMFQKEIMDSNQTEDVIDDVNGQQKKSKNLYSFDKEGSRVYYKWGEYDIINKMEYILKTQQNIQDGDDYFIVTVDGPNSEINIISNFNEFTMVPILQHYTNILGQINQGTLSEIFRTNLITE